MSIVRNTKQTYCIINYNIQHSVYHQITEIIKNVINMILAYYSFECITLTTSHTNQVGLKLPYSKKNYSGIVLTSYTAAAKAAE